MKELQPELSEILKRKRREHNMTFEDFAKLCGVSLRTAKSAEKGDPISINYARKMLDAVGVKMVVRVEFVEN